MCIKPRCETYQLLLQSQHRIQYPTLSYSNLAPRFSHSHSIVRIVPNWLIRRYKRVLRLENSRRPNRQMRMAFEFKEEFDRSRNSPLSATINIDRSTFPNPLAPPHRRHSRKLPSAARGIDRDVAWSDRSSASDRITASVAGDLPRVSRAIRTIPREAARTRRAGGIRTP